MVEIADKLRVVRAKKNLSQAELARKAGVSQITISNVEIGKTVPSRQTQQKIESVLGPVDWRETIMGSHI